MTGRLLDLLAALQTGRRLSGGDLASRLRVSPRTVRRDVERLREYGYPVATQPGPSGYYQLSVGTRLPPMVFDDDEAVATLVGLAILAASEDGLRGEPDAPDGIDVAADRAFGKIDQLLPQRLRPRAAAVRATVEATPRRTPHLAAGLLAALSDAAAACEVVTFNYTAKDGAESERRVEPYRQVHDNLRWYLLAWDLRRDDWRTFRLDRVESLGRTGRRFTPRALPADSGSAFLRVNRTAPRHRVVLTVDAPAETVGDALRFQVIEFDRLDAGRCRITARVDSFDWLIVRMALLGVEFVIEDPAEFADRCGALGQRMLRASISPSLGDTNAPGD